MSNYVFGHSSEELERLTFQAQVLQAVTSRLLTDMGVGTGMRVLDLGCGAGDVAMLVGKMVGPRGSVLGIDRSPEAVELAAHRSASAGLPHVTFEARDVDVFTSAEPFDCVVGRYVMVHQADPVAFIRKAASLTKPGGTLGFHEILLLDPMMESHPPVQMWDLAGNWIVAAIRAAAPHHGAASRLIEYFSDAGLASPALFCERPIGGGEESLLYRWAFEGVRGVYPHLVRMGVIAEGAEDLSTFESRLRSETVKSRAQLIGPTQIGAWTII
jgi:SAM-dependent methyltransferase